MAGKGGGYVGARGTPPMQASNTYVYVQEINNPRGYISTTTNELVFDGLECHRESFEGVFDDRIGRTDAQCRIFVPSNP